MTQIAKILLIFFFIIPIPFIPDSIRSSYLYLILNIFIILLAIESGILGTESSISYTPPSTIPENAEPASIYHPVPNPTREINMNRVQAMKKCPSKPSLFFIGGTEDEPSTISPPSDTAKMTVDDAVEFGEQELFSRAETFIRNFYLELKIQREDSWKKIHGLYAKTFWNPCTHHLAPIATNYLNELITSYKIINDSTSKQDRIISNRSLSTIIKTLILWLIS